MNRRRVSTEEVLVFLGAGRHAGFFRRLREEGMFLDDELWPEEAEELRLAKILMDELGVNAAGVEVALHLRRRLFALESRAQLLAEALEARRRRS